MLNDKFAFGICTDGKSPGNVDKVIDSIIRNNIPEEKFEIIIIGGTTPPKTHPSVRFIPFNEEIKTGWITRKKNIIVQEAKFDNVLLVHDYFMIADDWYSGFLKYEKSWNVLICPIVTPRNERFIDWTLYVGWENRKDLYTLIPGMQFHERLLPYDMTIKEWQYLPGNAFMVNKHFYLQYPLDENLVWGQEDIVWTEFVKPHTNFSCNPHSKLIMLKDKINHRGHFEPIPNEILNILKEQGILCPIE